MDRIQAARVFIEIVERGSMIGAAEHLDMSRSMVTRYLSEIEDWAATRLLHRSTRRLSLTPAGELVLQNCRSLLTIADDIPRAMESPTSAPSGHLRISCAPFAAEYILMPTIEKFCELYPLVTIELSINNATVDLVEERIDLAIRITSELDPNVIARPLGRCQSILCASPEYIKKLGQPVSLQDLGHHNCLIYSYFGNQGIWRFMEEGEPQGVAVTGKLIANDSGILLTAALKGMGISYQPSMAAKDYLASGELVSVLPGCQPVELGIYGVYSSRKHMPQGLRLLLDMLANT